MSNQGKWKLHTELNKVILGLSDSRHTADNKQLLEIAKLISELAAIRDRVDKLYEPKES
jgi:hypothetical protein